MRFLPASASSKTRTIISGTEALPAYSDQQEESKLPPGKNSSLRVFNLVQFNDSILWAGTRKGSIFQINTHTLKVTSLPILPHTNLYITYIYPDSHQRIWIGTDNNGLYVSDRNGNIIAFYSKEQLGSNAIKGIIEDEMSNVWVGTGNGLCCIKFPNRKHLTDIPRRTDLPIKPVQLTPPPARSLTENCISELSTV